MSPETVGPVMSGRILPIPKEFNDDYREIYRCPECGYTGRVKVEESFDFVKIFCDNCDEYLNGKAEPIKSVNRGEEMESENIALFDMDGTIVDFDGQMRHDINLLKSPEEPELDPWDRSQPYMQERRRTIMRQVGWWRNLPQLWSGVKLLNAASKLGYQIHILTKGPSSKPDAWKEKVEWCHENLDMHSQNIKITMTEDKGLVYGKILVDDFPEYIERWLQWRPRGLVIMPAHDHNKKFKHPNVIRYSGDEDWTVVASAMQRVLMRKPGQTLEV